MAGLESRTRPMGQERPGWPAMQSSEHFFLISACLRGLLQTNRTKWPVGLLLPAMAPAPEGRMDILLVD